MLEQGCDVYGTGCGNVVNISVPPVIGRENPGQAIPIVSYSISIPTTADIN
jgi:hypothetical protein